MSDLIKGGTCGLSFKPERLWVFLVNRHTRDSLNRYFNETGTPQVFHQITSSDLAIFSLKGLSDVTPLQSSFISGLFAHQISASNSTSKCNLNMQI